MRWGSGLRLAVGMVCVVVVVAGAAAAVAAAVAGQQGRATKLAVAALFTALPLWLLVIHSVVPAAPPGRPSRRSAPDQGDDQPAP